MAHDNTLEGTTYIHHGADHTTHQPETQTVPAVDKTPPIKQPTGDTGDTELLKRLENLEREFEAFKVRTAKKLKILEKNTHTQLTAEERVFMIQEDS